VVWIATVYGNPNQNGEQRCIPCVGTICSSNAVLSAREVSERRPKTHNENHNTARKLSSSVKLRKHGERGGIGREQ
jgi:hypothetical protein